MDPKSGRGPGNCPRDDDDAAAADDDDDDDDYYDACMLPLGARRDSRSAGSIRRAPPAGRRAVLILGEGPVACLSAN